MVLFKKGEVLQFSVDDIRSSEIIMKDDEIHERFKKMAADIKKIAPKAEDFLYFTAVMMHAAERSIYDDEGDIRKTADGRPVEAHWDINEKTGSWVWNCNDPSIRPLKNNNGDIFPESQLKIAYKKWIGKPLCKDHQSSSVDGIRGIILDTYWDDKHKRIIALCALDKVNYPDLARKVASGYANNVSMGTAVSQSICTECGNVATTEAEYCPHVKNKTAYGEVNVGLNPIELSLVVNGADGKAKVLEVLAAAMEFESNLTKTSANIDISLLKEHFEKLSARVFDLENEILSSKNDNNFALKRVASERNDDESHLDLIKYKMSSIDKTLKSIGKQFKTEVRMPENIKRGFYQGTEEPTPGKPQYAKEEADKIRDTQDTHMTGLTDLGPVDGLPSKDLELKRKYSRASLEERRAFRAAVVDNAQKTLNTKVAYPQGTEPKTTYPVDPGAKVRDTEFAINNNMGKLDGVYPGDEKLKPVNRASLKARFEKAGNAGDHKWKIIDKSEDKVIFSATLSEITNNKPALYASVATKDFARNLMKTIKSVGLRKATELYKSAQTPPVAPGGAAAPAPGTETPGAEVPEAAPEPMDAPAEDLSSEGTDDVEKDAAVNSIKEILESLNEVLTKMLPPLLDGEKAVGEELSEFSEEGMGDVGANPEENVDEALQNLGAEQDVTASLKTLKVVLAHGLSRGLKKSISDLRVCKDEIDLFLPALTANSDTNFVIKLAKESAEDARKAIKEAKLLQMAFVKYAKGSFALEKRASIEAEMKKVAAFGNKEDDCDEDEKDVCKDECKEEKCEDSMKTAEERKQERHKLAATVASKMKFSDMIGKAHPKGGTKLTGISGTDEDYVEDITEVSQDMQTAVSHEPKVKKAAAELDRLVKAGKINASQIPEMVKNGLDKDVAGYWKKYYGQVDGGSEFAAALLKDYSGSKPTEKKAEDEEVTKAKVVRAYDMAYVMANVGLIKNNRDEIRKEADKISKLDDNAYSSIERIVSHHAALNSTLNKNASSNSVQIGVALDSDNISTGASTDGSMYDTLVDAFAGRKY